jgi:hypothetical protein
MLCVGCLVAAAAALLLPAILAAPRAVAAPGSERHAADDVPIVDPEYIYSQLFYMATSFQHREAGYDGHQPASGSGHAQFADYWAAEMVRDLQGFAPVVRRDPFPVRGWVGRPATSPAYNVEVSVPGAMHPEQVVVIGCHYDGEAVSTQSANDDASGCAIELGVARAMAQYWRSHDAYPERTLRFVIFDAEEQGLYGSFHYVNETINGDLANVVAMFNEEQSGIAYPLRFLGDAANPLLPLYLDMTPLQPNQLYSTPLTAAQQANVVAFRGLITQAIPAVFAAFRTLGYQSVTYRTAAGPDASQPIFTPGQTSNLRQEDDTLGASDEVPFTLAGLPCVTPVGNFSYYDPNNPPLWSYPYDQPEDTIQLMNIYAGGTTQQAQALVLALALPGMLTAWMLSQPTILGQVAGVQGPIAAISDVGPAVVGQTLALDASASFDPSGAGPLSYTWTFGDGATASGVSVTHTYATAGAYPLTLTVRSPAGTRQVEKMIDVSEHATTYTNPYAGFLADGRPRANPLVHIPTPVSVPGNTQVPLGGQATSTAARIVVGGLVLLVLIGIGVGVWLTLARRRGAHAGQFGGGR